MCGIIGVLNLTNSSPIDAGRLRAGNDAMFHRGPDDDGMFVEPNVGMAMRRLSIVDLAHGHQPMANEDGTIHIVYNGEVYNHKDLRLELESLGHRFKTDADTEAVLHGYEQWGREGVLERLRGMFAFAIWDSNDQSLFLARDRMGIKPLYFAEHDGRFYFASGIRAMLLHSGMSSRANLPALSVLMQLGFVTAPHTVFEGIQKMPPAHCLWIKGNTITRRQYWDLSYKTDHTRPEKVVVDEFRERLRETIDTHLMSDVPLGAFLSGGVDSTATVAFMTKLSDKPVKTVTLGFEAGGVNEADWAADSARELGTDHHCVMFGDDGMDALPSVLYHLEEPTRPTALALYHMFKGCRERGLKVVITGEGSDELLGGYPWHQAGYFERQLSRLPLSVRDVLGRTPGLGQLGLAGRNLIRVLRGVPTETFRRYEISAREGRPAVGDLLFSAEAKAEMGPHGSRPILDSWAEWMSSVRGRPEFEQMLWIQSRTRMPDYINHGLDRMSMAHSIEARPPFLDHTLWEFCATVPSGLKLRDSTEKYLLRKAGEGIIPEAARVRKKKALTVPFTRWAAKPQLPEWAETAISETQLKKTGLFDPAAVLRLRRTVQTGQLRNASLLTSALAVQIWSQLFLESPLADKPPV